MDKEYRLTVSIVGEGIVSDNVNGYSCTEKHLDNTYCNLSLNLYIDLVILCPTTYPTD